MSVVSITQVGILVRTRSAVRKPRTAACFGARANAAVGAQDNPSMYTNPLQFEIQYECTQHLQHGAQQPHRVSRLGLSNARRHNAARARARARPGAASGAC